MRAKKKALDPIPEAFASYEEAAAFWDTHDTSDYPEAFTAVPVKAELRRRRYEVEIEQELLGVLRKQARKKKIPMKRLVNDMLRRQLARAA